MINKKLIRVVVSSVAVAILAQAATATTQGKAASLPNGASALNETYQDWQVSCVVKDKHRQCAMSQGQQEKSTGKRVLTIGLTPSPKGGLVGSLVLPFGLTLPAGVNLQDVVNKLSNQGNKFAFQTCLPTGCVVPLSFDAKTVVSWRSTTALTVSATANATNKLVKFSVSMNGFQDALTRTRALMI